MPRISNARYQGGIIVDYSGVLIHSGKTYWRKETYFYAAKKDVLPFMDTDDVVVRAPVINKKNRYNYIVYTLMWDYEVDIHPDLQEEGSIVMDKNGRVLEPITEFYHPIEAAYLPRQKWWKK